MKRPTLKLPAVALATAVGLGTTGCDMESQPAGDMQQDTTTQELDTMDQSMGQQEIYEARLEEVDGSGVTGVASVTIEGEQVQVAVAATELDPNVSVPQHIHLNASCDDPGGILVNLDDGLTLAGEAQARGDAYPESNDQGRLQYEASRSMDELRSALQEYGEAADSLNLTERVVNLHNQEMQSIACGPLEPMEQGGSMEMDTADPMGDA